MDSVQSALWLAVQTPDILWYSPPGNSRGICARKYCNRWRNNEFEKSSFCAILSHCFGIYYNNYSPQCRWLVVDIYLTTLATSTSVRIVVKYSYSQYWTGASLHCKLVPVQYWEYECGVFRGLGDWIVSHALNWYFFIVKCPCNLFAFVHSFACLMKTWTKTSQNN